MRLARSRSFLMVVAVRLLAWDPIPARADWLYFARGGAAELPAAIRGDDVAVAAPGGERRFPRASFRAIVPAVPLDAEWRERQARARDDGMARAGLEAAWWALERGLTPEAIAALRDAATAPDAPGVAPLARAGRMLARLDASGAGRPDLDRLRASLGPGWTEARGRHVVLLHQATPAEADERLDVLDRVVATFCLSLAIQGVEVDAPARPLVSVYFARRADYVAYLRRVDAAAFADAQGFYHPTSRVVFACDTRSDPAQAEPRRLLARDRRDPARSPAEAHDLDRRELLLDLDWRGVDLGIAAHETVHQCVAATGLAPRYDDFPHWLHEGFAAQFEVVRGGRWAGFGRTNDRRVADWRAIRPAPRLGPLLRDDGLTGGYRRDRYAEAWALVYFLRKARPAEFAAFLDRLRAPRPAGRDQDSAAAFVAAFGADLPRIERDWRAFLRDQATPLEAHDDGPAAEKSRPAAKSSLPRPDPGRILDPPGQAEPPAPAAAL